MTKTSQRRHRRSPTQWAELITEFNWSGLSAAHFCKQADISQQTFYAWKKKLVNVPAGGFTPVRLRRAEKPISTTGLASIAIELGNGRIIRVSQGKFDAAMLRAVVAAVESSTTC